MKQVQPGNFCGGVIGSMLADTNQIGRDKLRFDVWGVDILVVGNCESGGVPGKINVTETLKSIMNKHFGSRFESAALPSIFFPSFLDELVEL